MISSIHTIERSIAAALDFREGLLPSDHDGAFRLFNGYSESFPGLVVDIYGKTLVLYLSDRLYREIDGLAEGLQDFYTARFPWLNCSVLKVRSETDAALRRGRILFGREPDRRVSEHGVVYALDLCLNQDASFYLETRSLRLWLKEHSLDWRVLNTFAYTGSLGVAALAGGAQYVLQVDRSQKFLAFARQSAVLSRLDLGRMKLRSQDFYQVVADLKKQGQLFDCAILDPPYFSTTEYGSVNLAGGFSRLINKVRPLLNDQGWLVAINNALFYSGESYLAELDSLCADGFLRIEALIDAPSDVQGFSSQYQAAYPTDPAPFNHPTKIVLLKVLKPGQPVF